MYDKSKTPTIILTAVLLGRIVACVLREDWFGVPIVIGCIWLTWVIREESLKQGRTEPEKPELFR